MRPNIPRPKNTIKTYTPLEDYPNLTDFPYMKSFFRDIFLSIKFSTKNFNLIHNLFLKNLMEDSITKRQTMLQYHDFIVKKITGFLTDIEKLKQTFFLDMINRLGTKYFTPKNQGKAMGEYLDESDKIKTKLRKLMKFHNSKEKEGFDQELREFLNIVNIEESSKIKEIKIDSELGDGKNVIEWESLIVDQNKAKKKIIDSNFLKDLEESLPSSKEEIQFEILKRIRKVEPLYPANNTNKGETENNPYIDKETINLDNLEKARNFFQRPNNLKKGFNEQEISRASPTFGIRDKLNREASMREKKGFYSSKYAIMDGVQKSITKFKIFNDSDSGNDFILSILYLEKHDCIFYTEGLEKLVLKKIDLKSSDCSVVEASYKYSKKNNFEKFIDKNWNESLLFFKNGKKRIEIYSKLEKNPPKLFTVINDLKGDKLADFLIYGDSNKPIPFGRIQSFGEAENNQNLQNEILDSSTGFQTFILLIISTDGFVCPYQVRHSKRSQATSKEDSQKNQSNFVKRLKSPKIELFQNEELTTASMCPNEKFVTICSATLKNDESEFGGQSSRLFLFKIQKQSKDLIFFTYVDLIEESYSKIKNSFFGKVSMDFNQGTKQPFIIAFTHGGDYSMVIFRVNCTKKKKFNEGESNYFSLKGDNLVKEDDNIIEKIGVVKNYHSKFFLSMSRYSEYLWTMDSSGIMNRLDSYGFL